jgi:hypothetical protein
MEGWSPFVSPVAMHVPCNWHTVAHPKIVMQFEVYSQSYVLAL